MHASDAAVEVSPVAHPLSDIAPYKAVASKEANVVSVCRVTPLSKNGDTVRSTDS